MTMANEMFRADRLARSGYGVEDIIAAGVRLSPQTIRGVVMSSPRPSRPAPKLQTKRQAVTRLQNSPHLDAYSKPDLRQPPSFADIVSAVAERHCIGRKEILSATRARNITKARQEVCYLAYTLTRFSLLSIGSLLSRDHTTVLHSVRMHAARFGLPLPGSAA